MGVGDGGNVSVGVGVKVGVSVLVGITFLRDIMDFGSHASISLRNRHLHLTI